MPMKNLLFFLAIHLGWCEFHLTNSNLFKVERIGTLDTTSDFHTSKKKHQLTVGEFWQKRRLQNNLWGLFFVESLDITESPGSQIQEILPPREVTNVDSEKQWDWKTICAFWNGPLFKGYSGDN